MNMAVENGHGAKLFQIRERLRAVLGSPSPIRIDRPQRDMRKDNDRRAGLKMLDVFFEPLQLVVAQRTQSARLQIHHVDQADEVHAFLLKAIPSTALRPFAETLEIALPIVVQDVVLAWNIEDILRRRALQNLLDAIELLGLREVADVPRVQQKLRRRGQRVDLVDSGFQRRCNIRIRRLVKTHMAVANLYEAQL